MNLATAILIPLFALVVLGALLAASRLVRALRERHGEDFAGANPERLRLLDEKARLLQTIHDLEHEHSLGKLSEADYTGLRGHFEREAVTVLDRLEQLDTATSAARSATARPEETPL